MSSSEFVTSTGGIGADHERSAGRSYYTLPERATDPSSLLEVASRFSAESSTRGRRRWVMKFRSTQNVLQVLEECNLPIEARLPLSLIDPSTTDEIVMLGQNIHRSDVPEWNEVYKYWAGPNGNKNPISRIEKACEEGFVLTSQALDTDVTSLTEIWRPFGWNEGGVREFIQRLPQDRNLWFSGVYEQSTKMLVAACMGERLDFAGVAWCEGTEYGTAADFRGKGLCTAAVVNLHAQIIDDVLYRDGTIPLIVSELNMSARSDVIARHAGMVAPYVEGVQGLTLPRQVLRMNVPILDGEPNDLSSDELTGDSLRFMNSYGEDFSFWRNFIVAMLPKDAIDIGYSQSQISQMKGFVANRR